MSSTNKTTYYELPQFVDNDIFNPLVDDNDAYAKIDTALHNIAEAETSHESDIVSVKSRLDSAEGDIDALEAQNGDSVLTTTAQTLSGAVNELDTEISALDGRLDIVENDINNVSTGLKVKVNNLENDVEVLNRTIDKKIVFIGDSYMKASYSGAGTSFARLTGSALGLTENVDYWISAENGYGFARPSLQFITLLQNIVISIADNDVTDVIVAGGANDVDYMSDIVSSIIAFNSACKTRFPNAKLHLAFTDWFMGSGYNYNLMIGYWKNGAYSVGASFVDGIWMAQHDWALKVSDGHPNATGQEEIAKCLINYLLTGAIAYPIKQTSMSLVNNQTNIASISGGNGVTQLCGKEVSLGLEYTTFTFETPVSLNSQSDNYINLAQILTGAFVGCNLATIRYLAPVIIFDANNNNAKVEAYASVNFNINVLRVNIHVPSDITASAISLRAFTYRDFYMNC